MLVVGDGVGGECVDYGGDERGDECVGECRCHGGEWF